VNIIKLLVMATCCLLVGCATTPPSLSPSLNSHDFEVADYVFVGKLLNHFAEETNVTSVTYEPTIALDFVVEPEGVFRGHLEQRVVSVLFPLSFLYDHTLQPGKRYIVASWQVGTMLIAVSEQGSLVNVSGP